MESDSGSNKSSAKDSLANDRSSRRRSHLKFTVTLVIFFVLIIAAIISVLVMIKRDYESESPAFNSNKAIDSVCIVTPYPKQCETYMHSTYKNNQFSSSRINISEIFSISLHTSIDELNKLTPLLLHYPKDSKIQESTASQCKDLFGSTLKILNSYLLIDEENKKLSRAEKMLGAKIVAWLNLNRYKVSLCMNWLEYDKGLSTKNVYNSLMIMEKIDMILDKFKDSVFLSFGSGESIVASLMSDKDFRMTVAIFGWQFIFLLLLICLLLRVW